MNLSFDSLRTRIVVFFAALLIIVQAVALLLLNTTNHQIAKETIEQELGVGERIFLRLLEQNRDQLEQSAALLASDFGFRQAVGTNDNATVLSALTNHGARAAAGVLLLVSLEQQVMVDTLHPQATPQPFAFPHLVKAAENTGKSSGIVVIDSRLYQLVLVPVRAPTTIAWVAIGFDIDDRNAGELKKLTALDVSFLSRRGEADWRMHATTLAAPLRGELVQVVSRGGAGAGMMDMRLDGEEYEARITSIDRQGDTQVAAVLQRSLTEGIKPFERVSSAFLTLALVSVLLSVIGSIFIARNITRPINKLAGVAQLIEQGDYAQRVSVDQKGEIGALASSFNHMLEGIVTREKENLRLAFEDHLTGLPNRAMFHDCLLYTSPSPRD